MPSRADAPFLPRLELYLYYWWEPISMPFRASASFLQTNNKMFSIWIDDVSMPFRAKAPFLRYPFENLGFMRFL